MTRLIRRFALMATIVPFIILPTSKAATWNFATSTAAVDWSTGRPIPQNSRFCLVPEDGSVRMSAEGGATLALVQSESNGTYGYLRPGTYTLNAGCYVHSVGNYTSGPGKIPKTQLMYAKRVADPGITLPGFGRQPYTRAGTSLVDGGRESLGSIQHRFLIDIYGLDDSVVVKVNGVTVLSVGFNRVNIYELTQDLKDGSNTISITQSDNNNGRCWDFGFRVGDAISWKSGAHFANTPCGSSLPKGTKVMYVRTYTFNFIR